MLTKIETTAELSNITGDKQYLLQTENLSLFTGGRELLSEISLNVSAGEIVTVIGPNGAGKTTLLRVLLGLIPFDSGNIIKKPKLRVGYLPQKITVDPILPLTVNRVMNLTGNFSVKQIQNVMDETGVSSLMDLGTERGRSGLASRPSNSPPTPLLLWQCSHWTLGIAVVNRCSRG